MEKNTQNTPSPNNSFKQAQKSSIGDAWMELMRGIKEWFADLVDLQDGMDREGTIVYIKSSKMMRGANVWMLICSIMIAALGLDLNSEAVIIGAMLISPLMSPILGIGLGVGINDRLTLIQAAKQFGISILIALAASTLYFTVTPLGTLTDMIEARTAPTLLDGFVAIFGGLAGIVSITRKDKSNAIPGVAIATALMPPLCVTGYGIAMGDSQIALNSFYLFFLNSFFIALTSYLVIRLLDFPLKEHPNAKDGRRARIVVGVFSLLLIIPGIMIFQRVVEKTRNTQALKSFVTEEFGSDCINYRLFNIEPDSNVLVVQLINRHVPDSLIHVYNDKLAQLDNIENTYLQAIPDYRIHLEELDRKTLEFKQIDVLKERLESIQKKQLAEERQDSIQQQLIAKTKVQQLDSLQWVQLSKSLKMAEQFADIDTISFGQTQVIDFKHAPKDVSLFLAHWNSRPNSRTRKSKEAKLERFLHNYFKTYAIEVDTFIVRSYY